MAGRHASASRPERRTARRKAAKRESRRHSRRRGGVVVIAGTAAVLALGGAGWTAHWFTSNCRSLTTVTVSADPSIAKAISSTTSQVSSKDLGCAKLDVTAVDSQTMQAQLAAGAEKRPDVWVADATTRVRTAGSVVRSVAGSAAATPVVVVASAKDSAPTWISVLGRSNLKLGNPLGGGAPAAALSAALAEGDSTVRLASVLAPAAQARRRGHAVDDVQQRLDAVADGQLTVVTEQQAIADSKVSAFVPASGTVVLDYPVVITTASGKRASAMKQVGERLVALMASSDGKAALATAGLRPANGAPLAQGVGAVTVLQPADPRALPVVLQKWSALALP